MPKFIIERNISNAGGFSADKLKSIAQKSNEVLCILGTDIKWIHSYVAGDKIYCIYMAPSEELILEHAKMGGFPANRVTMISNVIEPLTGE